VLEIVASQAHDLGLVVDDENGLHGEHPSGAIWRDRGLLRGAVFFMEQRTP